MKKLIVIFILTITSIQMSVFAQDFAAARKMCENYGFIPNTAPFAQCVQTEVNKSKDVAADSKLNEACIEQRNQIENRVRGCNLDCIGRFGLNSQSCIQNCERQLALRPICR
jgi:hypothetical protein